MSQLIQKNHIKTAIFPPFPKAPSPAAASCGSGKLWVTPTATK